jgi:hypothetical protein
MRLIYRQPKYSSLLSVLISGILLSLSQSGLADKVKQNKARSNETVLQGMSVMGNNEQPKVLYLIPWQPPSVLRDVPDPPPKTIKNAMLMMDPVNHQKQLNFSQHLKVGVQSLKSN